MLSVYSWLTWIWYHFFPRKENQEKEIAKRKKKEDEQTRHVYVDYISEVNDRFELKGYIQS